MADVNKEVEKR